jgi:hypothetical protein
MSIQSVLVFFGNTISTFGAYIVIFSDVDVVMRVITFFVAVGAGLSTWYYNYIKIKKLKEWEKQQFLKETTTSLHQDGTEL